MPKKLHGHQMVRIGYDLIVLGIVSHKLSIFFVTNQILQSLCNFIFTLGGAEGLEFSDSLFRLSCRNNICEWEKLAQTLKIARMEFVAIAIPDDFVKCH